MICALWNPFFTMLVIRVYPGRCSLTLASKPIFAPYAQPEIWCAEGKIVGMPHINSYVPEGLFRDLVSA